MNYSNGRTFALRQNTSKKRQIRQLNMSHQWKIMQWMICIMIQTVVKQFSRRYRAFNQSKVVRRWASPRVIPTANPKTSPTINISESRDKLAMATATKQQAKQSLQNTNAHTWMTMTRHSRAPTATLSVARKLYTKYTKSNTAERCSARDATNHFSLRLRCTNTCECNISLLSHSNAHIVTNISSIEEHMTTICVRIPVRSHSPAPFAINTLPPPLSATSTQGGSTRNPKQSARHWSLCSNATFASDNFSINCDWPHTLPTMSSYNNSPAIYAKNHSTVNTVYDYTWIECICRREPIIVSFATNVFSRTSNFNIICKSMSVPNRLRVMPATKRLLRPKCAWNTNVWCTPANDHFSAKRARNVFWSSISSLCTWSHTPASNRMCAINVTKDTIRRVNWRYTKIVCIRIESFRKLFAMCAVKCWPRHLVWNVTCSRIAARSRSNAMCVRRGSPMLAHWRFTCLRIPAKNRSSAISAERDSIAKLMLENTRKQSITNQIRLKKNK